MQPGQAAVDLARIVDAADGLRFGGLQAYHGSVQHVRDHAERHAHAQGAVDKARMTVEALSAEGFTCDIVGGAGTGTFQTEAASGIYNELQAGSYVFMDTDYALNLGADGEQSGQFQHALFVQTSVMSMPVPSASFSTPGIRRAPLIPGRRNPLASPAR